MATQPPRLNLTRDVIAKIVGSDPQAIKQFELLFGTVDTMSVVTIDILQNIAGLASAAATEAQAQVIFLAKRADPAILAPHREPVLRDAADVLLDQPANRQALIYDDVTRRWLNDFINLNDLGDVAITSPADGDILIFNSGTWVNGRVDAGDNISVNVSGGVITISTAGATGSFTAQSGETVSVSDGIITSIV